MSKMKHKETRIKWKNADFYLLYTIAFAGIALFPVSYTHLRAHET